MMSAVPDNREVLLHEDQIMQELSYIEGEQDDEYRQRESIDSNDY